MKDKSERGNRKLRFLDSYVGIPAVMLFGLFKRNRRNAALRVKRVAFLKTAAIGDTVILSAVVRDFKAAFPDAHLTFFTAGSNYETAHLLPGVDRIIKLPANQPFASLKTIKDSGSYDVWVDFGPWPRLNAIFSRFSNSAVTIGFKTKGQFRHYGYDICVEHSRECHELTNYKRLLTPLRIEGSNLPALAVESAACHEDRITIHMYPGGYKSSLKEWPEERWLQLIDVLSEAGYEIFLTGAKADSGRAVGIRERIGKNGRIHVVAGTLNLRQTAELLRSSRLVISVNTGIMHMASALGCNLVALHGPTSVKRWGPLNPNSISLQGDIDCSPCLNLGFEYACNNNSCMERIPISAVVDAITTFLPLPGYP
jgi:heptosyltransferase I